MSKFKEALAMFNKAPSKEDKKESDVKLPQQAKISEAILQIFQNKKEKPKQNETKNEVISVINQQNRDFIKSLNSQTNKQKKEEKPSKPIILNSNNNKISQKIEQLKNQNKNNNVKKEIISKEIKSNVKDKIKALNVIKPKEESKIIIKQEEPKILEGSKILSNEKPEMVIYQYPNKKNKNFINNSKILLFIGNNQYQFINAFINIYRDISYEDNIRYKIDNTDANSFNNYKIYYIKSRSAKYNITIISIPWNKDEFMNDILNIFNMNDIPKRINYICITLEEKKELNNKGIITLLTIFNIFEKNSIKNNIMILYSKDDTKYIYKENNKKLLFSEYSDIKLESIYNPQFFFINNEIIYEKNENNKTEWIKLDKEIKIIQNKIKDSISLIYDNTRINLFRDILSNDSTKYRKLTSDFGKYKKTEQIFIINYLLNCKTTLELSALILFLYNKILGNKKEITINNNDIKLEQNDNLKNTLYILSKVKFKKLNYLYSNNCDLIDVDLDSIKNLFSKNLIEIDLSKNNIKDISIFNNEENLINLNKLNLSYNKIDNVNHLVNCKLSSLIELNLSHNEISDINCLQNNLYLNKLKKLDLSSNKIKTLNKIDIKTLNYLNLLNNEISEGILDFLYNFCYSIDKLFLTKNNKGIKFQYYNYDTPLIELKYETEENKINEILKTISFNYINKLTIVGFNNFDFLTNESLSTLGILKFETKVNDFNIFNNIKFTNLYCINFCDDESILKGFNSLNIFPSIILHSIKIEQMGKNYRCYLSCKNPKFERCFIFDDLNFLKENFLGKNPNKYLKIEIAQNILDNKDNLDFFSYNEIISSFPIFKNLKADILEVNYAINRYMCKTKFHNHEFRMNFCFDDLNFINYNMFKDIEEISFTNIIFNDKIGITQEIFPKIKKLNLVNNTINSMELFYEVKGLKSFLDITSDSNQCKSELLEFFDKYFFMRKIIIEDNQIKINYETPLNFYLYIDKINKIKYFNGCKEIYLNNFQMIDNDIQFLNNSTLYDLVKLNLDGNKITNLNIINNIKSLNLRNLSLKNNLINSGIELINNKEHYELYSLEAKMDNDNKINHIISFTFLNRYEHYFNFFFYFDYLYDINKNFDIFKELNFKNVTKLNLSGINLKNINFMENQTFKYVSEIYLDKNLIEDISIFEKIHYYNNKLSLKQNPIRKGLHVLGYPFFRNIYMELDINKIDNEYKIFTSFKYPNIDIEFYISDINEIKKILECENTFIKLTKNDRDELKLLENDLILNKSEEHKKFFETILLFLDFLKEHETINIIKKTTNTELIEDNNIIFNQNNKEKLEKLFSYIKSRTAYYSFISEVNLQNLESEDEQLIQYLTFLYINNLKLIKCNFDLNSLKNWYIINLDLSDTEVTEIKGICELDKLKKLNLSNNQNIIDLYELKNAKFKNLTELYLSNDNLENLDSINMSDYEFHELKVLDLSNNKIKDLTPIQNAFKDLKQLNLENNNITEESVLMEIIKKNNTLYQISVRGNDIDAASLGIFKMIDLY